MSIRAFIVEPTAAASFTSRGVRRVWSGAYSAGAGAVSIGLALDRLRGAAEQDPAAAGSQAGRARDEHADRDRDQDDAVLEELVGRGALDEQLGVPELAPGGRRGSSRAGRAQGSPAGTSRTSAADCRAVARQDPVLPHRRSARVSSGWSRRRRRRSSKAGSASGATTVRSISPRIAARSGFATFGTRFAARAAAASARSSATPPLPARAMTGMPRRTADATSRTVPGPPPATSATVRDGIRDGLDDLEQQGRLAAPRIAVREDEVAVVGFEVGGPGDAGAGVVLPGHAPAGRHAEHRDLDMRGGDGLRRRSP